MNKHILLMVGMLVSALCNGRQLEFVTKDNQPIPDVTGVGYTVAGDSIASWVSNSKGVMNVGNAGVDRIRASHPDYSDRIIFARELSDELNRVTLSHVVNLHEIVVTPTDMEEFDTHTSYRLSQEDMARYANVLQSLNVIPNLTVLPDGGVFFEGTENVKILIDGVDASAQELRTISKNDVAKVDVYQTPPLRFQVQGVAAVLDIRLKSKIHGGNIGVDIDQAFQSLKGDNSAALYYNYRQSRFTLRYHNENKHYRRFRKSEVLDYDFDGIHYEKNKVGRNSKSNLDDNIVNISYQINKPRNFLYNIKAGISLHRDGETALQDVTTPDNTFQATNRLRTDYTGYVVGNYFEKDFGDRYGCLLGNVNYTHYSTYYNSEYNESFLGKDAINDSRSRYNTNLDAVFSELQYQLSLRKTGMLTIAAYGNYKHSSYVDTRNPFILSTGMAGGSVQWLGRKGPVRWYLSLGGQWIQTRSTNSKSYDIWLPDPFVNVIWRISRNVSLTASYSYGGDSPSIAQMSETEQWLDTRLVYHGNSALRPYRTHQANLRLVWNMKYLNLSFRGVFNSSPGRICEMYTTTDRYMLQTLVNLSQYREWNSIIDLTIKPLGNNMLTFWNRVVIADLKGRNDEYSWNGHRFQWMSNLALNLNKWTVALYYQYPGKVAEGQLERPRAQCWSATVLYRPMTDLSVGLELFMPFGKGFKESEYTVHESPVHANTQLNIMDRNNLFSLQLSYNFSFGRNRNRATPQFDNGDDDTGILRK